MAETNIRIKKVESPEEMKATKAIRLQVFVTEQNIPEPEEFDEFDNESEQFIAYYTDTPIGTARYRTTDTGIKFERFAVLPDYRHKGVGTRLMQSMLKETLPLAQKIYTHAQVESKRFYEKLSFITTGAPFSEAGINHIKMFFVP